jgi:hypothetical protein
MEKTRRNRIILSVGLVTAIAIIAVGYLPKANSFSGFKGKTLWDWLSLLVVPASLAGLGALLQLKEQQIAEDNRQEEALQHYLDRVSNLVIEKNLPAIAANVSRGTSTPEERELLNVSLDVIRTMTLTVLRRLDGGRKGIVVQFLFESDLISSHFYKEDLAKVNRLTVRLKGADLSHVNLSHASLNGAKFARSILSSANLSHAYLCGADFRKTNLIGAKLDGAWLIGANLLEADFSCAEGLTKEQLEKAYLCFTKLPEGIDMDPDRDCDIDWDEWLSEKLG